MPLAPPESSNLRFVPSGSNSYAISRLCQSSPHNCRTHAPQSRLVNVGGLVGMPLWAMSGIREILRLLGLLAAMLGGLHECEAKSIRAIRRLRVSLLHLVLALDLQLAGAGDLVLRER